MPKSDKRSRAIVIMPSVVEIKIGTRLQFNPYTGPADEDISWQRARAKQYVRVTGFEANYPDEIYVRFESDGYETENSYPTGCFLLPKPTLSERIQTWFIRHGLTAGT